MRKPGTKQSYRQNAKKIYERHHGVKVPDGYQIHHVLPIRLGGTDDIDNLSALAHDEHAEAHMELYQKYGDVGDLCAYYLIKGMKEQANLAAASAGGKAAAAAFKKRGQLQGFQAFDSDFQKEVASMGGKVGGAKQRDLGLGIHAQTPEERKLLSSVGGAKGCLKNGWKESVVQSENGKRGGPKNKGFRWVNDGIKSYKLTAREQETESLEKHLKRTGRSVGRVGKFTNQYTKDKNENKNNHAT